MRSAFASGSFIDVGELLKLCFVDIVDMFLSVWDVDKVVIVYDLLELFIKRVFYVSSFDSADDNFEV